MIRFLARKKRLFVNTLSNEESGYIVGLFNCSLQQLMVIT
jgi:hypothetical protein